MWKITEYRNVNKKKIFHKEVHQIINSEYSGDNTG